MSNVAQSSSPMQRSEALTPVAEGVPAVITTPQAFTTALARWERDFNVLTPFTTFSSLAPGFGVTATIVKINPDASKDGPREVYDGLPFLAKGREVAIAKKGLRKLAEGAGISTQTYEIATGERFWWKVKAIATYRGTDGAPITREATKEWDLRDGSPQMRGWKPDQVQEGRKHGLRNCEARAINAAIRECGCGIDQKYSIEQLQKPFLVVRVSLQPDMSDPEVKRMVTREFFQASGALYGGAAAALPAPRPIPDDEDDDPPTGTGEPRLVGRSTASTPAVDPNAPPTAEAVRIVEAKVGKTGTSRNGAPWTLYLITDSHGVEHKTFDTGIFEAAEKAKATKAWVELATETKGDYTNLVEIMPAGQSPKLPMDGSDEERY